MEIDPCTITIIKTTILNELRTMRPYCVPDYFFSATRNTILLAGMETFNLPEILAEFAFKVA